MKSIAYAESKLGAKMGTPTRVATQKNQPVKYDVEEVAQIKTEQLGSLANESGQDLGDCDIKDEDCIAKQHKVLAEAAKSVEPKKNATKVEAVQANSTAQAKPAAIAPMPSTPIPMKKETKTAASVKVEAKVEEKAPEPPKEDMISKSESEKLINEAHDKGVSEGLSQGKAQQLAIDNQMA